MRFAHCLVTIAGMCALACGGAQAGAGEGDELRPASQMHASGAAQEPRRTVAEDHDLRVMLRDVAVQNACKHELGEFHGLGNQEESGVSKPDTWEGRMLIERCHAEPRGEDELVLKLGARAWRWVGKKTQKMGATFEVSQYATMKLSLEVQGKVEIAYAREGRVVNVWLVPTRPAQAKVEPLLEMDAEAKGTWSELLGAFGRAIGKGPDQEATRKVRQTGSKQFEKQLGGGYSLAVDMCTGQRYEKVGSMPQGKVPPAAFPPEGRRWLENERVRLRNGGMDLTGPFEPVKGNLETEIEVEEGGPLRARVVCEKDAARLAVAFSEGKKLPNVPVLLDEVLTKGPSKKFKVSDGRCRTVLYTSLEAKAKSPTTFRHIVSEPGDKAEPVVPCGP